MVKERIGSEEAEIGIAATIIAEYGIKKADNAIVFKKTKKKKAVQILLTVLTVNCVLPLIHIFFPILYLQQSFILKIIIL